MSDNVKTAAGIVTLLGSAVGVVLAGFMLFYPLALTIKFGPYQESSITRVGGWDGDKIPKGLIEISIVNWSRWNASGVGVNIPPAPLYVLDANGKDYANAHGKSQVGDLSGAETPKTIYVLTRDVPDKTAVSRIKLYRHTNVAIADTRSVYGPDGFEEFDGMWPFVGTVVVFLSAALYLALSSRRGAPTKSPKRGTRAGQPMPSKKSKATKSRGSVPA